MSVILMEHAYINKICVSSFFILCFFRQKIFFLVIFHWGLNSFLYVVSHFHNSLGIPEHPMKPDPVGFNLCLAIYVLNVQAGQLQTKTGITMGKQEEEEICGVFLFF